MKREQRPRVSRIGAYLVMGTIVLIGMGFWYFLETWILPWEDWSDFGYFAVFLVLLFLTFAFCEERGRWGRVAFYGFAAALVLYSALMVYLDSVRTNQ